MYFSSSCIVNSQGFSKRVQDERWSVLNLEKHNQVLRLFGNMSLDSEGNLGTNGYLVLSGLKIQEKTEIKAGEEVSWAVDWSIKCKWRLCSTDKTIVPSLHLQKLTKKVWWTLKFSLRVWIVSLFDMLY